MELGKISAKQIDEVIEQVNFIVKYYFHTDDAPSQALQTILSVLQHVKQHGLAIGEEEIRKIATDIMFAPLPKDGVVHLECEIAKSLAERQKVK